MKYLGILSMAKFGTNFKVHVKIARYICQRNILRRHDRNILIGSIINIYYNAIISSAYILDFTCVIVSRCAVMKFLNISQSTHVIYVKILSQEVLEYFHEPFPCTHPLTYCGCINNKNARIHTILMKRSPFPKKRPFRSDTLVESTSGKKRTSEKENETSWFVQRYLCSFLTILILIIRSRIN